MDQLIQIITRCESIKEVKKYKEVFSKRAYQMIAKNSSYTFEFFEEVLEEGIILVFIVRTKSLKELKEEFYDY
jgi:hypothetical protein